jgi:protein pelota
VGGATTTHRAKIEKSMPRKRGLASMGYEKALETFHKNVLAAVLRHVDFAKIKCLVVAGPGFEKETFARYVDAECSRLATNAGGGGGGAGGRGDDGAALRALAENKSRLLLVHASTAFKGAVREVLEDPSVMARVKDTKAATEVRGRRRDCSPYDRVRVVHAVPLGLSPSSLFTRASLSTFDR